MFNLLRRTRQKKAHKNKNYDVSDEEDKTPATGTTTSAESASNSKSNEHRCVFSARESSSIEHPKERERMSADRLARRAVIEELEDFGSDTDEPSEEWECVNLAKTAAAAVAATDANGHSAISWRSENLNINKTGAGIGAATTTTGRTTTVEHIADRNVSETSTAAGHLMAGSQNEANNGVGHWLIGGSSKSSNISQTYRDNNNIDGNDQRQEQIVPTVINAQTEEKVTYRQQQQQSKQSNEQKRQSRLSLSNLALHLSGNRDGETTTTTTTTATEESPIVSKKRKTLQKSRDFLSEIFMARGRNHHRNQQQQRNHQQQQQQQQQLKSKTVNDNVIVIGQALAARPTALASAHLETNSDPAATASTNSYQMTMSNNSRALSKEREREHARERSNSNSSSRSRSNSNSAGAMRQQEQYQQQPESERVERRDGDELMNNRATAASANFIQAANVELFTVAADQHSDATLQRNNNNSNNTSDITSNNYNYNYNITTSMGQTSAKQPNEQYTQSATASTHSSRASTPRDFRESVVRDEADDNVVPVAPPRQQRKEQQQQQLPKITVVDCSFEQSPSQSPQAKEIFYESNELNIEELNEAHVETLDDEVFVTDIPTTVYQQANAGVGGRPWTRLTNVKLENVQEEEDEDAEPEPEDDELDEAMDMDCDHERHGSRQSASSERSALKSDSNLSSSYADSGIGMGLGSERQQTMRCSSMLPPLRTPFIRDGHSTSTDCDCDGDELLLQCDELDDHHHHQQHSHLHQHQQQHFNEQRLVCIESISLPDVVVESTTATSSATTTTSSSTSGTTSTTNGTANSSDGHLNINIQNGASGNSLGNVHFIPIHIEGGQRSRSNSPKFFSQDDSCLGRNVEIVEDGSVLNNSVEQARDEAQQELRKELKQQKVRFNTQLEDAHKNVQNLEAKVSDMQIKIQNLEQELSLKQWNVDRLQGELTAAQKDDEYVRKKLKLLEDEKIHLRHKYSDDEDEFRRKYNELEAEYNDLTEKYKQTQSLASGLHTQVANAQVEVETWRNEVTKIRDELEDQIRILKNALENSEAERKICEDKWQKEFEMLRTHNREREDTLMSDCEWQMRQMQRQCKDKLDKSNYERKQAAAKAEELELELQSRRKEAESLRICQAQVKSLSGVVSEQERSIQTLMERIDNLKGELETANNNLETQIEAVHKIKYQCDNAIYDKERQMIYRIDEVRNEAAAFWENKLYTEMTRLTNELESVYVDERRDALDKLQAEHIEELRALTNRYTANEEELRAEIEELTENLELKKQDFLTLRERSDNALLQTRMHLDRADREYQNAMCREEDRRVELEQKLKKEFEEEKEEMEEKFRERLSQVKEEFAKELQLSTQEMVEKHRKELETQKAKLQSEKDEAIQQLVERHRAKMAAAEERINDVELRHQRNLKDLKAAYDAEKAALDKRDISNANEIEQLHRKCRCLTNLFEEMRMRYERRDPRAEDLREISELRTRCDSQERDLFVLTDRLREMQIQMAEMQQNGEVGQRNNKSLKKPPPKTIATSCDVIYEENEDRESPEHCTGSSSSSSSQDDGEDEEEGSGEQEPSDTESNHTIEVNGKCTKDHINEDDTHMISAV